MNKTMRLRCDGMDHLTSAEFANDRDVMANQLAEVLIAHMDKTVTVSGDEAELAREAARHLWNILVEEWLRAGPKSTVSVGLGDKKASLHFSMIADDPADPRPLKGWFVLEAKEVIRQIDGGIEADIPMEEPAGTDVSAKFVEAWIELLRPCVGGDHEWARQIAKDLHTQLADSCGDVTSDTVCLKASCPLPSERWATARLAVGGGRQVMTATIRDEEPEGEA